MDLKDYQDKSAETAIYADEIGMQYETLGLCSEVGEFLEKSLNEPIHRRGQVELIGELGGCLWYLARLCDRFHLSLEEEIMHDGPGNLHGLIHLPISSGILANHVKKVMRDDEGMSDDRFIAIQDAIIASCQAFAVACVTVGVDPREVASFNYDQLKSRQERGKLQGDGDDR